MVDSHSKSFFGQNTGILVSSYSRSDPFTFMRCFKKKSNGIWEKLSSKEGKSIKFSLEEIVLILRVLNRQVLNWQSQHDYKDTKTSISFNWEDKETEILWINIGKYSKRLDLAQTEILRLLLSHFLEEKIIHSTLPKKKSYNVKTKTSSSQKPNKTKSLGDNLAEDYNSNVYDPINRNVNCDDMSDISGLIIGETDKAFLIKFDENPRLVLKSAIKNHSTAQKNESQKFLIDNWILKKLHLIS